MPSAEIAGFWDKTRAMLAEVPVNGTTEPVEGWADRTLTAYRVILDSFENIKIRAWYFVPNGTPPQRGWPAIMELPSGGGVLPLPGYFTRFGYATLSLFPRSQGESIHEWQMEGDDGTLEFRLLYHVTDHERYYYRGGYMDCIRGLDFLEGRPEIDSSRLAVTGASQGGGLSLGVASLDRRVNACIARLPGILNFPLRVNLDKPPSFQYYNYLVAHPQDRESVVRTLAYFDPLNLVEDITCPTLMSTARKDAMHPLHFIMPVFEKIQALKSIIVYDDADGDEAGVCNVDFNRHTLDWLERYLV